MQKSSIASLAWFAVRKLLIDFNFWLRFDSKHISRAIKMRNLNL